MADGFRSPEGAAYPFGLGSHGRVVGVARGRVREEHFHVVRHFFEEVGRNQPLLAIELPLPARDGAVSASIPPHLLPRRQGRISAHFKAGEEEEIPIPGPWGG